MTDYTIGVDISKEHLDVYRLRDGASQRFSNDKVGHKALIKWIGANDQRVIYEPTGAYHRALEQALACMTPSSVTSNSSERHEAHAPLHPKRCNPRSVTAANAPGANQSRL